ncbi:MAG: ABC transporter permease [Spirochaetaceae bacterium]|jgi:peptide/nickel transport system permease protein|nr:ABC transporter permease [Spirochaetaceae bacterium]
MKLNLKKYTAKPARAIFFHSNFPLNTVSRRFKTLVTAFLLAVCLLAVFIAGLAIPPLAYDANFSQKNLPPSAAHLFGTDHLGRDMFSRTIKGLSTSIIVGTAASAISACLALVLGSAAALFGKKCDAAVTWLVDVFQSVPHIIFIILISIAMGKGLFGVLIGVAATHWTSLTRLIRSEIMQLKDQPYINAARALGKNSFWIAKKHILPHVLPQFAVGLVLLFPHAVLHEAAITFLGFGLSPEQPAVGVILSEAMRYLSAGMWHLAFFPGAALLLTVLSFDALGENLRALASPATSQL